MIVSQPNDHSLEIPQRRKSNPTIVLSEGDPYAVQRRILQPASQTNMKSRVHQALVREQEYGRSDPNPPCKLPAARSRRQAVPRREARRRRTRLPIVEMIPRRAKGRCCALWRAQQTRMRVCGSRCRHRKKLFSTSLLTSCLQSLRIVSVQGKPDMGGRRKHR